MKKKRTVRNRMNSKLNNQTKIMTVSLKLILMKSRMMIWKKKAEKIKKVKKIKKIKKVKKIYKVKKVKKIKKVKKVKKVKKLNKINN